MPTTTNGFLDRGQAVKTIAGHLADRDAYVVTGSPHMTATLAEHLDTITGWTAYLDNGLAVVLRTNRATAITVASALMPTAAVITMPKTIPADVLSKALGRQEEIPPDGSQDIVILHDDGPVCWSLLFVDALEIVDPRAAAQIRASHLPNLN